MAVTILQMRFICLILLLLLIMGVSARRGGGSRGSSSRGGSRSISRSHSSVRVRSGGYSSVPLSGRIMRGSSSYSSSTWRAAAMAGLIYGGIRYTRIHPHRNDMPTICTNQKEKSPEGAVYGYFICPRENESDEAIYCCGPDKREYCCNRTEAEIYFSQNIRKSGGVSIGTIIGIIVAIALVIALGIYCCKKRKHAGEIIRRFSKKERHARRDYHGPQAVPLNSPDSNNDGTHVPAQPPPSYTATFDGQPSYPAQPYPADSYPPGAPQPYPPYGMEGEKMGLPPPGVDAMTPYPMYPGDQQTKDSAAPYPPFTGAPYESSGAPYPPPSVAPYPTSGAPYPTSGAPYSASGVPFPTSRAPYPTSGAPYPTSGAPYPTSGAPYPPESGDNHPPPSAPNASTQGAAYPPASTAPYTNLEPLPYQDPTPTHPAEITETPTVPTAPMEPTSTSDNNNSSTHPSYQ